MTSHWPTAFSIAVAESSTSAHHIYHEVLPVHSHGPTAFSVAVDEYFAWAHLIHLKILPVNSHGPTVLSAAKAGASFWPITFTRRWYQLHCMGPLLSQ